MATSILKKHAATFNIDEEKEVNNLVSVTSTHLSKNSEVHKLFQFIAPFLKLINHRSFGETLIWRAEDISIKKQQKEEVIFRIHNLFKEVKKLDIRANCLVTDLAKSYAAAHHYLRYEMHDKTLVTKDNAASDDNLRLLNKIKVTVNCDSF
ncbi:5423_t:CDS:2 [Cetraspora pellucida]|uniref:5423_t:CDS:1 n=1 Tax=Cetraspora pellucida TaxID=1433469 RepID=A0A9N9HYB3_9GLOM|nr:5423_t:CDS:2 [Cetraspora pellucida]